jgi:uroporphyrinogen-III synthase
MHILVTRPLEDAEVLARKLESLGHRVTCQPLLAIVPRPRVEIPHIRWQAVLATSANATRTLKGHGGLHSLRMLTVGPQSLAAARDAGFARSEAHGGDVEGLASYIADNLKPDDGPLLYLSGAETAGDLQGKLLTLGFDCQRVIVYDAVPATDGGTITQSLKSVDAILLYSPRSARIWRDLVTKAGLLAEAARPTYFCLSMNVAKVLPEHWPVKVARSPDESAMLALLEQTSRTG